MIGAFDSGLGGLSVLAEIRSQLPEANLLYVADRARGPFGVRPLSEVLSISHDICDWLLANGASTLVVACNTASAAALRSLRETFPNTPIVGMEPAVKPASIATRSGVIGVFATEATFQGELFASLMDSYASELRVLPRATPEWVELVESGHVSDAAVRESVKRQLNPVLDEGADVVVLGCTHFSFLKETIVQFAGPDVEVIDPAPAVAEQTARTAADPGVDSMLEIAVSGDVEAFKALIADMLNPQWADSVLPFTQ